MTIIPRPAVAATSGSDRRTALAEQDREVDLSSDARLPAGNRYRRGVDCPRPGEAERPDDAPQSAPAAIAPAVAGRPTRKGGPKPLTDGHRGISAQIAVYAFAFIPLLALCVAIPFAWGWGLTWTDIIIATGFYFFTGHGHHRRVPPPTSPTARSRPVRAAARWSWRSSVRWPCRAR